MNVFYPVTHYVKRLRRSSYQDPTRDWILLITLALIALAGIMVWNASIFDTVAGGGVIGTPIHKTAPALDASALQTIKQVFESRATEEAKYTSGTYHFVDPSQ